MGPWSGLKWPYARTSCSLWTAEAIPGYGKIRKKWLLVWNKDTEQRFQVLVLSLTFLGEIFTPFLGTCVSFGLVQENLDSHCVTSPPRSISRSRRLHRAQPLQPSTMHNCASNLSCKPRIYVSLRPTPTKSRDPPLIPQRPRHRPPALALRLLAPKGRREDVSAV